MSGRTSQALYLTLNVIGGRDLSPRDTNGLSDPYCVIRLSSGTGTKKTSCIRKTLNPLWNETFEMGPVSPSSVLKLTCWDWDKYSSDDFEGQFSIPLSSLCKEGAEKRAFFALMPRPNAPEDESITGAIEMELKVHTDQPKPKKTSYGIGWTPKIFKKRPETQKTEMTTQIYGVELTEVMNKQQSKFPELKIPKVCTDLLADLSVRGIQEEGIFRIGGRFGEIERLKELVDAGTEVNFEEHNSIHDVSGLFKKYLRELPTPLLTYEIFEAIIVNPQISFDSEDFLDIVRQEIGKLPRVHYELLKATVDLLQLIARNSETTKMSPENLVICIAPNVLWDKEQTIYANMSLIDRCTSLFSTLVLQHDYLFDFAGDTEENKMKKRLTTVEDLTDEARKMFITYDTNGDGDLQPDEFEVFYKEFMFVAYGEAPSPAEIQGAIIELDEDKDGEISLNEFTKWWTKLNKRKEHLATKFKSYSGVSTGSTQSAKVGFTEDSNLSIQRKSSLGRVSPGIGRKNLKISSGINTKENAGRKRTSSPKAGALPPPVAAMFSSESLPTQSPGSPPN